MCFIDFKCDFHDFRYMMPPKCTKGSSSALTQKRNTLERVLGAIHSLAEVMKEHITNDRQHRERGNGNENHMIDRFQMIRPPEFKGTTNPMEAKSWLM